jgi:hypothetical protein
MLVIPQSSWPSIASDDQGDDPHLLSATDAS